ncbi:hypothetical protein PVMG_06024 [Plasmodium vivax Mauritania I]|uniref:Vir protein n=1 Tax=Plasmodium vivax Mauritania I TaxID=1035515 RepID=A0A0J9TJV7_PLAVI|nr:hypothetical protein PVMG_06024 [Plasmodium vivax Mauritania I]
MNFWLNYQLGQLKYSKFTAKSFYDIMKESDPAFFAIYYKNVVHDINENDLNDMKKLYDLYKLYYDIWIMDPSITDGCITKANECVSLYTDFMQTCTPGVERNFCKALLDFKDLYNTLRREPLCSNKELPELPELKNLQDLPGLPELKKLPELQKSPELQSYDQLKSSSQTLGMDSERTQEHVQDKEKESISGPPTELPPEKNKMIGLAGSILGSSTVLFSIYLVKTF